MTTLLESVTSPVGALGLVPDRVRQCRFDDLARMVGHVAGPIAERRAESVWRDGHVHSVQHSLQGAVRNGLTKPTTRKEEG